MAGGRAAAQAVEATADGNGSRKRRKMSSPCMDRTAAAAAGAPAAAVAGSGELLDQDENNFVTVESRSQKKIAFRENRDLERLKMNIQANEASIFKVVIRKNPAEGGKADGFKEGTLLGLFKEVQVAFPSCKITGGSRGIVVGATSLDIARRALLIRTLGGQPVTASCAALSSFKARIYGVNPVFTEQEILTELSPAGVTHVKRLMSTAPGDKRRPLSKVVLTFDRQPPPSVALASRVYAVTLEADRPPLCFNCLRTGHFADRCNLPKACRRCGKHDHLAAQCTNTPWCVNCKGMHAAGAASCPRIAYLHERNRIMMEARALQQAQVMNPEAVIDEGLRAATTTSLASEATSSAEPTKTFAAVVRGIAVEKEGKIVPAVLLPKPKKITRPKQRRSRRVTRKRTLRAPACSARGAADANQILEDLSSLSKLLVAIDPQLAEAVRTVSRTLQPLLALVPLVQRIKVSSTR